MTVTETEVFMSRDEIASQMERGARERLGSSADQMMREYRGGVLHDAAEVSDLLMLADLLPKDDQLSPGNR